MRHIEARQVRTMGHLMKQCVNAAIPRPWAIPVNVMGWGHQYWMCHEYHGCQYWMCHEYHGGGITNTGGVMNIMGWDHQYSRCHEYHGVGITNTRGVMNIMWSSILDVQKLKNNSYLFNFFYLPFSSTW